MNIGLPYPVIKSLQHYRLLTEKERLTRRQSLHECKKGLEAKCWKTWWQTCRTMLKLDRFRNLIGIKKELLTYD